MEKLPPVHPDISLARTLDKRFYTESHWQDATRERIFLPSWQFVGHASDFGPEANCRPVDLLPGCLDEPLLLTQDGDHIRCMSNVCTHRGNILVKEACHAPHIRCRYHGRMFGLDGAFRSMPEFQGVRDFPSGDDSLPALPVMRWGDMLFTTLGAHSSERYFAEMMSRLSWLPMDEFRYRPDLSRDFLVKAHWALYCENYLEGFHIPFVHAGLNAVIDYGSYRTECFGWSNLQLGIAREGEPCFDLPEVSPDFGTAVAAYYFFVFPNLMFNFYPWGLSLNIVEPIGIAETRVRFLTYVWKEELFDTGAGSGLDTVEMEDEEVVEQVQRGIRSRLYRHGRFSVTREQGPHHFQRMVSVSLG
jgi:choline monooxygenase